MSSEEKPMRHKIISATAIMAIMMISVAGTTLISHSQKPQEKFFFTIHLMTPQGNKARELTGELLVTELAKIGIKVENHFMEFAAMNPRAAKGAQTGASFDDGGYDMYLVQSDMGGTTFPAGIYSFFRSDQRQPVGNNYNNYFSGRFDALINQALAETDDSKRNELVKQAAAVLYEDLPIIPLYHESLFYVSRKDIKYPANKDLAFWQTTALRWVSRETSATERDKTFIYAQPSDATDLLPGLMTSSYSERAVSFTVYEALFDFLRGSIYRDSKVIPLLAKSYDLSKDGLTYTFHLKDNVKWHDGEKFTAADVKFTYYLVKNPAANYGATKYFQSEVKSVDALDDYTVSVTLTERVPDPFDLIFGTRILPMHILKDVSPDKLKTCDLNTKKAIGTGPWKWVEWKKGEYVRYAANADYHAGKPWFDTLYMRVIPEAASALAAIQKGEIDATEKWYGFTAERKQIEKDTNLVIFEEPSIGPQMLRLNLLSPALANVWVRQAISSAIPRQHIVDAFCAGSGIVANEVLNPMSPGYNKNVPKIVYDITKATAFMVKAGYNYDWLKPPPETPLSAYLLPAIGGLVCGLAIGALAVYFVKKPK